MKKMNQQNISMKEKEVVSGLNQASQQLLELMDKSSLSDFIETDTLNRFIVNTSWSFVSHKIVTAVLIANANELPVSSSDGYYCCVMSRETNDISEAVNLHHAVVAALKEWSAYDDFTDQTILRRDHITTKNDNSIVVITSQQKDRFWTRCYLADKKGNALAVKNKSFDIGYIDGYAKSTISYDKGLVNHEQMLAEVYADL